jgi:hypothetical protein
MFQPVRVLTAGTQATTQRFAANNLVYPKATAVAKHVVSPATSAPRYAMANDTATRNNLNHLGR